MFSNKGIAMPRAVKLRLAAHLLMIAHCLLLISKGYAVVPSEVLSSEGSIQSASYCDEVTAAAIDERGWRLHPDQGRVIERIHIISLPV